METLGEPVCPRCGGLDAYAISTRRRFKCKACYHQFSVTSGTIFAWRKMSLKELLAAVASVTGQTLTKIESNEADGVEFVTKVVSRGSVLHADEASHWHVLHALYQTYRINHEDAYSFNGACTNQAESFLARLRRMVEGQHHHVSPGYLYQFANEASWKEDHRRDSNGDLTRQKLSLALAVSRVWAGYWQRC